MCVLCVLDAYTRALHVLVSSWYMRSLEFKKQDGNVRLFELQVPLSGNQPGVALRMHITVALWKRFWNVLPEQPSTGYGHTRYFIQWGLSTRKGLHRVRGKKGTPKEQNGHSKVCRGANCEPHPLQGLGAKRRGAVSTRHSEKGPAGPVRGPRREHPSVLLLGGRAALHRLGWSSQEAAWPLSSPDRCSPAPPPLSQASSTCPKCHTCLCWCPRHQALQPPPWTA